MRALFAALLVALVAGAPLAQSDGGPPPGPDAPAAAEARTYLDPAQPVDARIDDLLGRMTLDEKIGQMTQINLSRLMGGGEWDRGPLNEAWVERTLVDAHVGSLLSGGGAAPVPNEARVWAETVNELQRWAVEETRLGIPILYGVDAVHGHNNVLGATIYPHNLGLAASFDAALVAEVAEATAEDVAATGIHWSFAPVADLGRDPRWGRFYETFGESPAVASAMVGAYVEGQQRVPRVAGTLKHFVGYGAAESGLDRAPAELPLRVLRGVHLPAFAAGVRAGAPTVMINSGSVNGVPVHASRYLLTDVLRGELGFAGVALSDWNDIDKLFTVHRVAADLEQAVAMAVNAGVDVVMVPHDAAGFAAALRAQVEVGAVPEARVDEAVRRVLQLKFDLGLFEEPYVDPAAAAAVVEETRELAARAARESMTLLENRNGVLPLREAQTVLVTGPGAFDVPMQMGGWTIGWQGVASPREAPPAITILEAMQTSASDGVEVVTHDWMADDLGEAARGANAVVLVLGEPPYAETPGDDPALRLPEAQARVAAELAAALDGADTVLTTVLLAGRPVLLPGPLQQRSDALLMAYLPGSEGGTAVADVLFGRVSPAGRLPFTWPASTGQLPIASNELPAEAQRESLYQFGRGLSYARFRYGEMTAEAADAGVMLRLTVENTSDISADHVVLAWVAPPGAHSAAAPPGARSAAAPVGPVMRPARELAGFARTTVDAGASQEVRIFVPYDRLAVVAGDVTGAGERTVPAGRYTFEVGDRSEGVEVCERAAPLGPNAGSATGCR